ncbi:MAG: hypothetical protein FK734_11410 [Asgard group archaeon]|nr:hypothetical protein [Asgard group archaeon]
MAIYYNRFYRIYGFVVSAAYASWIIIGFSFDFPFWAIFLLPIPLLLFIYFIWYLIRYITNPPENTSPENKYRLDEKELSKL